MVKKAVKEFGKIDILVNNAGILEYGPFSENPDERIDKVVHVNLIGLMHCTKKVIPYMKKQGGGKIINIASTVAFSGLPHFLHYSASKGSVVTMTRGLATALGEFNINVNAVAPGLVMTETMQATYSREFYQGLVDNGQLIHKSVQPEDIAAAVLFLASDEADKITGQTLAINAGEYLH